MSTNIIPLVHRVPPEIQWKNKVECDKWLFYDPFQEMYYSQTLSIKNCNEAWSKKYKEWVLFSLGNGFFGNKGAVQIKYTSLMSFTSPLRRICQWGSIYHPKTDLKFLTEEQKYEFLRYMLFHPLGDTKIPGVMARKTLNTYVYVLNKVSTSFFEGKVSDGFYEQLVSPGKPPYRIPPFFEQQLIEAKINVDDWTKGTSFGTIPVYIAMALLGYAIETIRSKKAQLARQIFRWVASIDRLGNREKKITENKIQKIFSYINAYNDLKKTGALSISSPDKQIYVDPNKRDLRIRRKDKYIQSRYHDGASHTEALSKLNNKTGQRSNATKVWQYDYEEYLIVHKYLEELFPSGAVPFIGKATIKKYTCYELRTSALVILLCLTGARSWSEILKLTYDDIELRGGVTWYSTPITKTNHGIKASRQSSYLINEAISLIRNCLLDQFGLPAQGHRPVFTGKVGDFVPIKGNCVSMAARQLMQQLTDYYDRFVNEHPDFKNELESLAAHQFRHTWAEFALRRFEGDVPEVIRKQFMHSFGSSMTNDYNFAKLEPETRDALVCNYLKEVLQKIGTDYISNIQGKSFEREFQGKAIQLMNRSLKSKVLSINDVSKWAAEQAEEYIQIQAHEYGYCLLRKNLVKQAKCYDDNVSIAVVGAAEFSDCSACPNFAANKGNNLADIKRQAIAHQSTINRLKERFPHFTDEQPLIRTSTKIVKQATKLIKEWKL